MAATRPARWQQGFGIGVAPAVLLHASLLFGLASIGSGSAPPPRPRAAVQEPVEVEIVSAPVPLVVAAAPIGPTVAVPARVATLPARPSPRSARRSSARRTPVAAIRSLAPPSAEAPDADDVSDGASDGVSASAPAGASDQQPGATGAEAGAAATTTVATPRYRSNPPPEYPRQALRRHEEGVALVGVTVGVDGRARGASIARSSGHPLLDQAAVGAVEGWIFDPARIAGQVVSSRALVPVRFSMTDR